MKQTLLMLICCPLVLAAFAEGPSFDRYKIIIEQHPFGEPPPNFDPTKVPSEVSKTDQKQLSQEQEKIQSAIHFSVIDVMPDGSTAVGFTDNTNPKVPVHYYLAVGESRNGWKVKEADPLAATMTISKDEIEVTLSLGGNSAKDVGATKRSGDANGMMRASPYAGLISRGAKRRLKEQEEARQREAARQAQEEENRAGIAAIQQNIKDLAAQIRNRNQEQKTEAKKDEVSASESE